MSVRTSALRGAAFFGISELLDRLSVIVVILVLARLLEPWEMGIVAQASALIVLFTLLAEQGLGTALIRTKALPDTATSTVFWTTVFLGSVFTLLGVLVAPFLAAILNEPMLSPIVTALSFVFILSSLGITPRSLLSREMRFFPVAVAQVFGVVLGSATAIGVAIAGGGVWAIVAQMLVMRGVNCVTVWTLSRWSPDLRFSFTALWPLLGFGTNVTGIGLVGFGLREADRLAVGFWLPTSLVGQWGVASQVSGLISRMLQGIVQRVTLPAFSAVQDDNSRLVSGYLLSLRLTLAITAPLSFGIAAIPHDVLRVAAGPGWEAAASAARFLAIHALVISLSPYATQMLLASGRSARALLLAGVGALSHLGALAIVLSTGSGLEGRVITLAAGALALRSLLYWIIPALSLREIFGVALRRQIVVVGGPMLAATVMGLGVYLIRETVASSMNSFAALAIFTPAGGLLYLILLRMIDREVLEELITRVIPAAPGGTKLAAILSRIMQIPGRHTR